MTFFANLGIGSLARDYIADFLRVTTITTVLVVYSDGKLL